MPKSKTKPDSERVTATSSPAIRKEAIYLGLVCVGLLLLIAVIVPSRSGVIGRFFRSLLVGLFGFGGLAFPIALIFFAVVGLISKKFIVPWVRSGIVAWLLLAWLHIILAPIDRYYSGLQYLRMAYNHNSLLGGGLLGAVLGSTAINILGRGPAILVLSVALLIMVVLLTGRSFVNFIERSAGKARDFYEERRVHSSEETYDEPKETAKPEKIAKNKPSLKPVPQRKTKTEHVNRGDEKAELFDFDPDDSPVHDDEDDFTVLLVQEELDAPPPAKDPAAVPHFLRGAKPPVSAPKGVRRHAPLPSEPIIDTFADDVLGKSEPNAFFDDEYNDGFDDHFHELDIHDDSEYDYPEVVVKGLVDSEERDTKPPLFEYDEDDEYDEYAHVSRLAGTIPFTPKGTPDPARGYVHPSPPHHPALEEEPPPPTHSYEDFELPHIDFLAKNDKPASAAESRTKVMENSRILEETLRSFRVEAKVVEVSVGPTVTRYDLAPGPGVKVSSIANLTNDLALSLAAQGIRIEAPIPGKSAVGIEIPNKDPQGVYLREIIENDRFENFPSKLAFAVGKDIAGSPVVADVADMPHLLIAGATGAGKSVCINTLIASILYKARPDEVKLLMVDPKVVELSVYNGIPHLLIPVVTDPKKASGALNWAVQEMENRYASFAETGCRDLKSYNRYLEEADEATLPQIVIIIDELADLMMTAKGEVEEAICRLAQKARAAGIHLIVATQRPSVDVITGLIKANIPSRLAFAVSSGTDSRTVLDMQGAEKLLGRGDMLFLPRGQNKPIRVQGGFISDKEVEQLVAFLKAQAPVEHTTEMIQQITMPGKANIEGETDEFFHDAVDFLLVKGKASTSMLQRQFRIGYNRASRLMEDLELRGIVGPEDGVKPRKVTITRDEYREIYGK